MEADLKHPRTIEINQPAPFPCCTSLGWFGLSDDCQKTDLERLGIGIGLYFKTLKVLMIAFLSIVLLNGILYYFFFTYGTTKKVFSFDTILPKLNLGNMNACNLHIKFSNFWL